MTPLTDTHVHLWDPARGWDWLRDAPRVLQRRYGLDELTRALRGGPATRVVVVEAGDPVADAAVLERIPTDGAVAAVVVGPQGADAGTAAAALVRGVRDSGVPISLGDRHTDPGSVLELMAPHRDPDRFVDVARTWSGVVVIDHVGSPPSDTEDRVAWRQAMLALAAVPTACVKISGLLTLPRDVDLVRPLRAFGPDRVLVGSDWPVCLQAGGHAEALGAAVRVAAEVGATPDRLEATARRVYRLD